MQKHALLKGTFILTATGLLTRVMGFFYRIFLSHTFGEEGVGLYQLIFPVYALVFSLTSAGLQIALSRTTAHCIALGQKQKARIFLLSALFISLPASFAAMLFLQKYALFISISFLHDKRCYELLILLSYVFPFSAIHSCICGYALGLKQIQIPAISQLLEQIFRIGSVFLIFYCCQRHQIQVSISLAVAGLLLGEMTSAFYSLNYILGNSFSLKIPRVPFPLLGSCLKELFLTALPLTGSRVLLNVLQSIEAVSIPSRLQLAGSSVSESLSTYGVLTGMALPLILFPSAITNSISTMLLPTVAEIQALNHQKQLTSLIQKVTCTCILLGSLCGLFLFSFGKWLGLFLFHSELAGNFIVTLAWICPFLYTNNALISIINGLGKTTLSLAINSVSLSMRIVSIYLFIPKMGIYGYLWGLLLSQLCTFFFSLLYLIFRRNKNWSTGSIIDMHGNKKAPGPS